MLWDGPLGVAFSPCGRVPFQHCVYAFVHLVGVGPQWEERGGWLGRFGIDGLLGGAWVAGGPCWRVAEPCLVWEEGS